MCVCVFLGVLCEGYRYLDGRVSPVCLFRSAGVRRRQLCLPATQGAAEVPSEKEEDQGTKHLNI